MSFSSSDFWNLFQEQSRKYGALRGFLRAFRKDLQRLQSRALLQKYLAPRYSARGIELGAGEQTIAPQGTLLTDAYREHAGANSRATEFFPAESIPYPDQTFDFVLNEHVLEHMPDVIKALREWKRVLRPGGYLFLFMPHPERTFDREREATPLQHFTQDFERQVTSEDDEHWFEWEEKVLKRGFATHYLPYDKETSLKQNLIHRHVFTPQSLNELLLQEKWTVCEVVERVPDRDDSFAIVAKKG